MTDRIAIVILWAMAIAGCSRWADPAGMPAATDEALPMQSAALGYERFYNFKGVPDGASPNGDLVYSNELFYGSTYYGGSYGAGTVFRMTASGEEHIVHSFEPAKNESAYPIGIALRHGVLYGATPSGGAHNEGTVFRVTTAGKERILYSFGSAGDAREPFSGLLMSRVLFTARRAGAHTRSEPSTASPPPVKNV
jgi:uncharacterized repeat protein (TIGR03803 family)